MSFTKNYFFSMNDGHYIWGGNKKNIEFVFKWACECKLKTDFCLNIIIFYNDTTFSFYLHKWLKHQSLLQKIIIVGDIIPCRNLKQQSYTSNTSTCVIQLSENVFLFADKSFRQMPLGVGVRITRLVTAFSCHVKLILLNKFLRLRHLISLQSANINWYD